jgi:hypothetical protein
MSSAMKAFIAAIAGMGIIRFILTVSGVPNDIVKYFSMTLVITIGMIYFALAAKTHKDRLKAAYLLILPYMVIEIVALGYTWASGRSTIFHTPEYSFGMGIVPHTLGHLAGGLTWEPLMLFLIMEIIWLISLGVRSLTGSAKRAGA